MKKRRVLAMLAAFIIAAGIFTGCGSGGDTGNGVPAGSLSEEERPEAEEAPEEKPADGKEAKQDTKNASPTENPAKPESSGNAGNTKEKAGKDTAGNKNAQSSNNSKPSDKNTSSGNAKSPNEESSKADHSPEDTQPSQPEAPAHEHVWQEHTATRQEWVPNIVVVDDYETQQVEIGCNIQCNCGEINPSDEHMTNHLLAGEPTNKWTIPVYEEQQVKVGSHEEDHGYYETVTYVDYYYCECGATK